MILADARSLRMHDPAAACAGISAFQLFADQFGAVLDQLLMLAREGRREMAVDVELSNYLAVNKDGHNDLRLGLERAGKIARIFAHVIYYDGQSAGRGRAADTLVQRDA